MSFLLNFFANGSKKGKEVVVTVSFLQYLKELDKNTPAYEMTNMKRTELHCKNIVTRLRQLSNLLRVKNLQLQETLFE